jgi:hypothetical protein
MRLHPDWLRQSSSSLVKKQPKTPMYTFYFMWFQISGFGGIFKNLQHSQLSQLILSNSFWHLYLEAEASR